MTSEEYTGLPSEEETRGLLARMRAWADSLPPAERLAVFSLAAAAAAGMEPLDDEADVRGYDYWLNVALGAAIGSFAGPGGAYTGAYLASAAQQPQAEALYRYGSGFGQRLIRTYLQ